MSDPRFEPLIAFIRQQYPDEDPIPLHVPRFAGREAEYLTETIRSTYVSYVGPFVREFERQFARYVAAEHAVAVVSGTAGLHLALLAVGVRPGDEVITQPLTFVATANAIRYVNAHPVFVDIDAETLGLSPDAVAAFLRAYALPRSDGVYNRRTGRRIAACLPVHTFGHPMRITELVGLCREYGLPVVEDAAEALGSWYQGRHAGTFGRVGVFSFNGNKIVTTGGGGMIVTQDPALADRVRHLSTTAKVPHPYEYVHDEVGYNYRMPNVNAAVGLAQLEQLPRFLEDKRALAHAYRALAQQLGVGFVDEPPAARSNFWLNALLWDDEATRTAFLEYAHRRGVLARAAWRLMPDLPMYRACQTDGLPVARSLAPRLVNIPSSVRRQSLAREVQP
ncbi:MAG: LegC family aminotransferase [Chloroflexi bacterium]|nr:LegC family aminotransferase [Chloroflexota bacterium]